MADAERSMQSIRAEILTKGLERRRAAKSGTDPKPAAGKIDRRAMWRRAMQKAAAEALPPT